MVLRNPPKWAYQILFLKQCISILEYCSGDVQDGFYEQLVQLQLKETTSPQKWIYRHYPTPTEDVITIKETPQIISDGTTGMKAWEAGIWLADWMFSNKEKFQGKRLLELGSGTGATGLIISRLCAPGQLILSDGHQSVLNLLQENVRFNGLEQSVTVLDLNWNDLSSLADSKLDPEIILAADVVYDDTIFKPFVNVLLQLTERKPSLVIYLAATVRNEETLEQFLSLARQSGLTVKNVCTSKEVENRLNWDDQVEIKLFELRGNK